MTLMAIRCQQNATSVKNYDGGGYVNEINDLRGTSAFRTLRISPLRAFSHMPRHTQPREVAELKGATRKHPERYRKEPPKVNYPLGEAPDHLSESAKKVWFEVQTYAPVGVLSGADRMTLETLSVLFAEFRDDPKGFKIGKYGPMISCLGRLGMSPADRQKLGTEKPQDENPFNAF